MQGFSKCIWESLRKELTKALTRSLAWFMYIHTSSYFMRYHVWITHPLVLPLANSTVILMDYCPYVIDTTVSSHSKEPTIPRSLRNLGFS